MTVLAGNNSLHHRHRGTSARDPMIARFVTFCTGKVVSAHVNIIVPVRFKQLAREVRMFNSIPAAPAEMTAAAGFSARMAHVFSHFFQVNIFIGHPCACRCFFVGPGRIMTDQTVHFPLVRKIERTVFPTITGMTAGATSLVADKADSVIVQRNSPLAVPNLLSVLCRIKRRTCP